MDKFPIAWPRVASVADRDTFQIFPDGARCAALSGFCAIDGRPAAVFAQEPTLFAGAMGLRESRRVAALMDEALRRKVPVVGLLHSSGAKIQEGVDSLAGYAEIFQRNVRLSGRVPQISLVLGTCAGGAVYSPALTDLVVISRERGEMFITGPDVVQKNTGEITDRTNLGGARVHMEKSGVAHLSSKDEAQAAALLRKLLSYLPSSSDQSPPFVEAADGERGNPDLEMLAREDNRKAYEVRQIIDSIVDRDAFLELQPDHARNIVTGLARLGGFSVGVVANNPAHLAGALDIMASMKAARFVRMCDSFNLPIVTLVDVPGYWPGVEQEHQGIIRHGAKLLHAYAEAEVPRITLVTRKAYGGAYCVMGSKPCGAAANFAWPSAEIAVMGPLGAVEVLYKNEIRSATDGDRVKQQKIAEYLAEYANPDLALRQGYIDQIIAPGQTRKALLSALRAALKNFQPRFKHTNIPL